MHKLALTNNLDNGAIWKEGAKISNHKNEGKRLYKAKIFKHFSPSVEGCCYHHCHPIANL